MSENSRVLDLRDYWRMVRTRLWVVAVGAVIVAALTAAYVAVRPPVYESRAKVLVEPLVDVAVADLSGSTAGELAPDMLTEAEVVKSVDIAESVVQRGGLQISPEALLDAIGIEVIRDTTVMYVSAKHQTPGVAATYANHFAEEYLEARKQLVADRVDPAIESLRAQIETLKADAGDTRAALEASDDPKVQGQLSGELSAIQAQIAVIGGRLGDIETVAAVSQGGRIVQEAPISKTPIGPNMLAALVLGSMAGALLGAGLAIVLGLRANRVAGRNELASLVGAPVLGVVPTIEGWSRREAAELITRQSPGAPATEAYRTLATNLRFLRSQRPLQMLVITSALPSEGKSTTAANLAVILAESGVKTLLVDADLRRPRVELFFGLRSGVPGFSDALEGSTLSDLLQGSAVDNLSILPGGAPPSDPVALLAGPSADEVFADLRRLADVVICDAPPTLPVADASILAERADGVVFVHDSSISSRAAVEDAIGQLRTAGAEVIGGIYNNMTTVQRSTLGYATYDSYYGEKETRHPSRNGGVKREGERRREEVPSASDRQASEARS